VDDTELGAERFRKLTPTGVFQKGICAKLSSEDAEPDDVSDVLGPDGYLAWEREVIEMELARVEIELLPLDRDLH
jgi:hypothetical protein